MYTYNFYILPVLNKLLLLPVYFTKVYHIHVHPGTQ